MSSNVEYDYENKRFYLYSNREQKIVVYSQASHEMLCYLVPQNKVYDPHLYLHSVSGRSFLMVIGGYTKSEGDVVQGSKSIEIF